ncbi:MAG TPA: phosphoribosyltransferase [Gemmatimonadales bacterium]|nr:phosphoribosyltransferase [Gemmatimonadales bacterium]
MSDATSSARRVYLCGPTEVATQVRWLLDYRSLQPRELALRDQDRRHWSHRIHAEGPVPNDIRATMDLLKDVVSLPVREALDIALTLDFYKQPDPDIDPMQWANTTAGELVNRAKYRGSVAARDALVERMVGVVRTHPFYAAAEYVAPVPGHSAGGYSFGVDLARRVAAALALPVAEVTCRSAERLPAKERDVNGGVNLDGEFALPHEVHGRIVLVVDDVWRSGDSMHALGQAARAKGARAVVGLTGARTMRGR